MKGNEFIETVLINEIGEVANQYPYLAFALMCIGIEFLGKCLHCKDIHTCGESRDNFSDALEKYPSLNKYQSINNLYGCLRCGLLHAFLPKDGVILSGDQNDLPNNVIGCKDFYNDFAIACRDATDITKNITQRKLDDSMLEIVRNMSGTTNTIKSLGS